MTEDPTPGDGPSVTQEEGKRGAGLVRNSGRLPLSCWENILSMSGQMAGSQGQDGRANTAWLVGVNCLTAYFRPLSERT